MSADYTHWKLTLCGLAVAVISLMMLDLGFKMIPGDDGGAPGMRLMLASIVGLMGGGGVFAYGVWRAGDRDDQGTDHRV
jgi:hypothetical protein